MFENFGFGTVLAVILAAAIGIYLYRLDKKEKSDPLAALYRQYATLSPDLLESLSDEELPRAVAVNILNRTDSRRLDVYTLIPLLSHGQTAVYSVWLFCNELAAAELDAVLRSPSGCFAEHAADGFSLIGAIACETALRAEDTAALKAALAAEQPLALCAAYIRDNPAEFTS